MKKFAIATLITAFFAVNLPANLGKPALESAPYTVVGTYENNIEERIYPAQKWLTVEKVATTGDMEKVSTDMFMNLFSCIRGKNDRGAEIPMTIPVSTRLVSGAAGSMSYQMGFYIPQAFQNDTPQPTNEKVKIVQRDLRVYSISFGGFAKEADYNAKMVELTAFLRARKVQVPTAEGGTEPVRYFVGYNSPMEISNRKNEVWVQVA